MRRLPRALPLLALVTSTAVAGEPERVVVRHRLYTSSGKLELSASAGLTPVDFLTDHKSLALGLGYNLAEQWALELEGGYALSRHTRVAQGAAARVVTTNAVSWVKDPVDGARLKATGIILRPGVDDDDHGVN